jgi:hypothetical protein
MNRMLTTQDISWFLDLHAKDQLNLEPSYQRRSVWSPRDKRFFIDTILNNYPAPPVFLHKTIDDEGRSTYHVVDGKQRLQSIIEFTQDQIVIPDDFSDITLQKKRWKDLPRDARVRYWNYELVVEMIPDVSDAQIRSTFERINRNSRRLTPQEMRHAKYDGWFIELVEREAEQQEWTEFGVVTKARIKRMRDVQFISELFAVVLKNQIFGFDQDMLDDLYAEYDDISELGTFVEDVFVDDVRNIKSIIAHTLSRAPRLMNPLKAQSNFYSLWSYLHLQRDCLPTTQEFVERYSRFMASVQETLEGDDGGEQHGRPDEPLRSAIVDYAANTQGASTDLAPRVKRHDALAIGVS